MIELGNGPRTDQHAVGSDGGGLASAGRLFRNAAAERPGSFHQRRAAECGQSAQLRGAEHRRPDAPRRYQEQQPIAPLLISAVLRR